MLTENIYKTRWAKLNMIKFPSPCICRNKYGNTLYQDTIRSDNDEKL